MLKYNEKTKFRKRMYSLPVFIVLLVLTVLVVKGTWGVYWKKAESEQDLAKVSDQAAALQSQQTELSADVSRLQTPEGVDEEIRKKFSVVKEGGEQMVVLFDTSHPAPPPPPQKPGFWKKMLNSVEGFFGGGENSTSTATETAEEAVGTSTEPTE